MTPHAADARAGIRPEGGARALDEAIAAARDAGLTGLPSEAFRFDLATRSFRLVEEAATAAFLVALGWHTARNPAGPERSFQALADAAVAAIARRPGADIDRLASVVVAGSREGLDPCWVARAAAMEPLDWRLADLYGRVVGGVRPADADGAGATLGMETAAWAPPAALEASLARLQEAGVLERGTDLPVFVRGPYLPPRPVTPEGARLLALAGLGPARG